MNVIGLSTLGSNTGACLVQDGKCIVFGEEERFVRIKTAKNIVPNLQFNFLFEKSAFGI